MVKWDALYLSYSLCLVCDITRCTLKNEYVAWQTQPMLHRSLMLWHVDTVSDNVGVGIAQRTCGTCKLMLCNCAFGTTAHATCLPWSDLKQQKGNMTGFDGILTVMNWKGFIHLCTHEKVFVRQKESALMSSGQLKKMPPRSLSFATLPLATHPEIQKLKHHSS